MDSQRFDALTRVLAGRTSRRIALRRIASGTAVTALAAAGMKRAAAQDATAVTTVATDGCMVPFEAVVRQGPSAGTEFVGMLTLPADAAGTITGGSLSIPDGPTVAVRGQVTGLAITLLFQVGEGRTLYGVGALENPLTQCGGDMGGPFVGPLPGDAGDWAIVDEGVVTSYTARRSSGCKGCLQGCRSFFPAPEPGACREFCLGLGGCTADDFVG